MSGWIREIILRVSVFVGFFVYAAAVFFIVLGIEGKTYPEYRVIMILASVLLVPFTPIAAGLLAAHLHERKRTCIRYAIGGMLFPGIWVFLSIQRHRATRLLYACRKADDAGGRALRELIDITQTRESRGVESLIQCVRGNWDPTIRTDAISWLSSINTPRVLEVLTEALKDKDGRARRAAADALGQIGDEGAVEPLRIAQGDKDEAVRQAAVSALERLRDHLAMRVCDFCSAPLDACAIRYSASQIREAARAGLRPPSTSFELGAAFGMSRSEAEAEWMQRVMADSADWLLCSACSSTAERYVSR